MRFALLFTSLFALLTAPRLLTHELWRDEAWLWIVVTEAGSFGELLEPLARSGQGYLFPFLCWLARLLWTSPRAMQLVHLVLASGAAFVFLRWAPFSRVARVLFVLGYFAFYEYAVISRHYAAGALCIWIACVALRERRALVFAIALALMSQTTVYGVILAGALACAWFVAHRTVPIRSALLAAAGVVMGVVQLIPEPGTSFMPGWRFGFDVAQIQTVLAIPWRAFVPLPPFVVPFWNRNLLDAWPVLQAVAGVLVLAGAFALLRRSRVALVAFGIGTAGILVFSYIKYAGVVRHQGHLWLLLVAAMWIGGIRSRAVTALLVVHCIAGVWASWIDLRHPFSNGAAIAELLRDERAPLLGHREPPAATVSLALGRPLYSPSRKAFVTHPDWGPQQRELTPDELRVAANELACGAGRDIVMVMSYELPPWPELMPMGAKLGAIQPSEDFRLYRLSCRR